MSILSYKKYKVKTKNTDTIESTKIKLFKR